MTQKENNYTEKQLFDLIASEPENEVLNAGNDVVCDPILIDEYLSTSSKSSTSQPSDKCGSILQQSIAPSQVPDTHVFSSAHEDPATSFSPQEDAVVESLPVRFRHSKYSLRIREPKRQ
jgi:hypothetical protein